MEKPEIEDIEVGRLANWGDNPRLIKEASMKKLCTRMVKDPDFLRARPLLVHDNGERLVVYAGNQRLQAARILKWETVPCIIEADLDEETIRERCITDNLTFGCWDWDRLANDWDANFLRECGFTDEDLGMGLEKTQKPQKLLLSLEFDDQVDLEKTLKQLESLELPCKIKTKK